MKHSAARSRKPWGRVVAATSSTAILAACLLGAAGFIPHTAHPGADATTVTEDAEPESRVLLGLAEQGDPPGIDAGFATEDVPNELADTADADAGAEPVPEPSQEQVAKVEPPPDPKKEPVSFFETPLPVPDDSGSGKRVVFSISDQYVWLVGADDEVKRSYPVSGSRFDQLEPGSYEVIRKRRHTTSWHGTESMEYMVTFTFGENAAIGFHDIPESLDTGDPIQTHAELGMALSDGCIRQRHQDAAALWSFAPEDTAVIVLP